MRETENKHLHGWDRFLYNMYMILTFPVRRWWIILSVLATVLLVLIIIPTLDGVKKEDIVDWYKAKWTHSDINKAKNKTIDKLSKKIHNLKGDILPAGSSQTKSEKKKESDLVAWNVAEFKKAKYVPNRENKTSSNKKVYDSNTYALIKKQVKEKNTVKPEKPKTKPVLEQPTNNIVNGNIKEENINEETADIYYEVRPDLNLEYLDEPETISGPATVSGANELYVDDTFVYLYGIYTNPRKYNLSEVREFLENITQNQVVECDIVAYSTQTQAKTALCFVNGVLLNRQMVAENMADNIALKME